VAITCTLSDTNLSTLDIQLVRTEIITPSDSATACQETPKSVEFALIIYEGVSKQSISNSNQIPSPYALSFTTTCTSATLG
jgi:hypothetical protein